MSIPFPSRIGPSDKNHNSALRQCCPLVFFSSKSWVIAVTSHTLADPRFDRKLHVPLVLLRTPRGMDGAQSDGLLR